MNQIAPRTTPALQEMAKTWVPGIRTLMGCRRLWKYYKFKLFCTLKSCGHLLIRLYVTPPGRAQPERLLFRCRGSGWDVALRLLVRKILEAENEHG